MDVGPARGQGFALWGHRRENKGTRRGRAHPTPTGWQMRLTGRPTFTHTQAHPTGLQAWSLEPEQSPPGDSGALHGPLAPLSRLPTLSSLGFSRLFPEDRGSEGSLAAAALAPTPLRQRAGGRGPETWDPCFHPKTKALTTGLSPRGGEDGTAGK